MKNPLGPLLPPASAISLAYYNLASHLSTMEGMIETSYGWYDRALQAAQGAKLDSQYINKIQQILSNFPVNKNTSQSRPLPNQSSSNQQQQQQSQQQQPQSQSQQQYLQPQQSGNFVLYRQESEMTIGIDEERNEPPPIPMKQQQLQQQQQQQQSNQLKPDNYTSFPSINRTSLNNGNSNSNVGGGSDKNGKQTLLQIPISSPSLPPPQPQSNFSHRTTSDPACDTTSDGQISSRSVGIASSSDRNRTQDQQQQQQQQSQQIQQIQLQREYYQKEQIQLQQLQQLQQQAQQLQQQQAQQQQLQLLNQTAYQSSSQNTIATTSSDMLMPLDQTRGRSQGLGTIISSGRSRKSPARTNSREHQQTDEMSHLTDEEIAFTPMSGNKQRPKSAVSKLGGYDNRSNGNILIANSIPQNGFIDDHKNKLILDQDKHSLSTSFATLPSRKILGVSAQFPSYSLNLNNFVTENDIQIPLDQDYNFETLQSFQDILNKQFRILVPHTLSSYDPSRYSR